MRLLGASGVFDSIGHVGENVVLGWVVLQLTDSAFMVGAALGVRMAPSFFLGLPAGTIADMVDRRLLMRVLNLLMAGLSVGIGLLIYANTVQVWHLFALTATAGAMHTLYRTMRQTYVYDIVGSSYLLNGLAIVSLCTRVGGLIGSLSLGFVIGGLGPDIAYFAMAISYATSASILLLVSSGGQRAVYGERHVWQNLKQFGVEICRNDTLLALVIMTAVLELVGFSSFALFPNLAQDVLDVGPEGLGVMEAFRSIGGILALVVVAVMGVQRHIGWTYLFVLLAFGVAVVLLGFASGFVIAITIITVISGMASLSDIYSQSMMQTVVPDELRGRAMGAWVVAAGTGPLGNLQIGALASTFTVGFALGANGAALIALALLGLVLLPKVRRL